MDSEHLYSNLKQVLAKRESEDALRVLSAPQGLIDFCSNDYLGLAKCEALKQRAREIEDRVFSGKLGFGLAGSSGSRLLSGNSQFIEELEDEIAAFHEAEAALIFNSGFDANLGLLSSVPTRHDTILYDELVHASLYDGMRLSFARSHSFRHNDLDYLEEGLKQAKGRKYIVVESIYSMDGDQARLKDLISLAQRYGALLIVDEAHAAGIYGKSGRGLVHSLGLHEQVFARIVTYGKAFGAHGAAVLGGRVLRDFLVNFARSFIYSTALPVHSYALLKAAYEAVNGAEDLRAALCELTAFFEVNCPAALKEKFLPGKSAIRSLIWPGNRAVKSLAQALQCKGFDLRPIRSPTVPAGKERLRLCLHAFNSKEQLQKLLDAINQAAWA
jgi:8-amino-7-oxononanoate synthase